MSGVFDTRKADAQATAVQPIDPGVFDYAAYDDYRAERDARCRRFWDADSGVLVYRRMRVAEVFSYGCADFDASLRWQLGALAKSMHYEADIANFLEPWYGIGTVAGAYGAQYVWEEGQAPAVSVLFDSVDAALAHEPVSVAESAIGARTLAMIDRFLNDTGGRLPMSMCDVQSPLNIAGNLVDMSSFLLELFDNADNVKALLSRLADLSADFCREQADHIGGALVWPGHGFASSRAFDGLGQSDDNVLMMSGEHYLELAAPANVRAAAPFGGPVFHSCGNWSDRIPYILRTPGLRMVDAAFGGRTDPAPNPPESFADQLRGTGVVLNARIVGDPDTVVEVVERLWNPPMKLIVVTYCETEDEQRAAYERVHALCNGECNR